MTIAFFKFEAVTVFWFTVMTCIKEATMLLLQTHMKFMETSTNSLCKYVNNN